MKEEKEQEEVRDTEGGREGKKRIEQGNTDGKDKEKVI